MDTSSLVQQVQSEIERLNKVLALLTDSEPTKSTKTTAGKKERKQRKPMSEETKRKMREAAAKRWAKKKGTTEEVPKGKPVKQ